jgi:hypothetical protein
MPKAGLEPAITASEQSKTVHASDRSATATGTKRYEKRENYKSKHVLFKAEPILLRCAI